MKTADDINFVHVLDAIRDGKMPNGKEVYEDAEVDELVAALAQLDLEQTKLLVDMTGGGVERICATAAELSHAITAGPLVEVEKATESCHQAPRHAPLKQAPPNQLATVVYMGFSLAHEVFDGARKAFISDTVARRLDVCCDGKKQLWFRESGEVYMIEPNGTIVLVDQRCPSYGLLDSPNSEMLSHPAMLPRSQAET